MGFASIDLSKLLFIINLDSYAILEYILNMLLLGHLLALLIVKGHDFLKVGRMAPCNLDGCRCLGYMREYSLVQRILLDLNHVLFDRQLLIIRRPQSMETSIAFPAQDGLVP